MRLANWCEGENCEYPYRVIACDDIAVLGDEAPGAAVIGHLHAGDTATVTTGNEWILEPGTAVLRRDWLLAVASDTIRFSAGDTVYLLVYAQQGTWRWSYRGQDHDAVEFWDGVARRGTEAGADTAPARSLSLPRSEMWLRLTTRGGLDGWWVQVPGAIAPFDRGSTCSR